MPTYFALFYKSNIKFYDIFNIAMKTTFVSTLLHEQRSFTTLGYGQSETF